MSLTSSLISANSNSTLISLPQHNHSKFQIITIPHKPSSYSQPLPYSYNHHPLTHFVFFVEFVRMEHQESSSEIFEKFTWKIENFSRLNDEKICSEPFIIGGYPWRIILYPKGHKIAVNQLSIYLEAVKTVNMSEGWSRDVKFKFLLFDQLNTNRTITKEVKHDFKAKKDSWGYLAFIDLTELFNPENGFIVKDACIVGVEVFVYKSNCEKQINQEIKLTVSAVSIEPTKQVEAELGYAALGRLVILLQTNKVKDMNEQTCNELHVLWEKLKRFKFDVTWLEPQVESALGMKSYVEKTLQVEKLKENMVFSELEILRLKAKLVAAELSLAIERDLLKAKGIKERDLDSDLRSESWMP